MSAGIDPNLTESETAALIRASIGRHFEIDWGVRLVRLKPIIANKWAFEFIAQLRESNQA